MRASLFVLPLASLLVALLLLAEDPWRSTDVIAPSGLATTTEKPLVIHVGFPVLYRAAHIAASEFAGPGSKPDGIESLKKAVSGQPHDRAIVLYCGCCPWDQCPNIRPAFAALRAMGYSNVKVVRIPENLKADWIDKGYPTDKRAE